MPRHKPDRSSVKRNRPVAPAARRRPLASVPSPGPEPLSRSLEGYEERIVELEHTITLLQARLNAMAESVSDLRDSRDHFFGLFDQTPASYVVHDDHGFITESNRAATELLGLETCQGVTVSLLQLVTKDEVAKWLGHLRRCMAVRRLVTVELMLRTWHGQYLPVRLLTQPGPTPHGEAPTRFHTIILDLTERRTTEAGLARTQKNYLRLVDTIEGIVWEADAHTLEVSFVSDYARRLLGYAPADWSRPGFWFNHIHSADRDRVAHQLLRAVEARSELRTEYRVLTAERQVFWLHDSITVVEQDGRLMLLGVAIDVTAQRRAQEQLRAAQGALEQQVEQRTAELRRTITELEAYSYSISHDLRAPLRAMIGFAELALNVGGEQMPARSRDFIERVLSGGRRADRMVQDLLSYSRVSRANFKLEPVDLEKLARQIVSQSPEFQPPRAEVTVQSPLLPVLGHEVLLSQALTNLLSNAAKFVAPGKVPQVRLRTEPVGPQVRLWVQDNGIGIEPHQLGRIFGIFERIHSHEQYEGTGIGLALVRKAVERMGGSVGVQSTPGQGSAFWLQLQAANSPTERSTP